jgi:GxxExxY protein
VRPARGLGRRSGGQGVDTDFTDLHELFMSELLYRDDTHRLIGLCMEIHRELGKGHDEVIYKDALTVELNKAAIPLAREKKFEVNYKGVVLPHFYFADFVVWDKILLEAKAVEKLVDAHVKQVLNYLAASKLKLGLLVNFGGDSLEWKRVIL